MAANQHIEINLAQQRLRFYHDGALAADYVISSAEKGAGETNGSEMTPRGAHYIRAKIGAGLPPNAVLRGRRFRGELFDESRKQANPNQDWILARILWLCGRELGRNRLGHVDSMRRYIYIHGTPDSEPMGVPRSHGCIRMRVADLLELFDQVRPGCPVLIAEF